jgi:hypothetical protein
MVSFYQKWWQTFKIIINSNKTSFFCFLNKLAMHYFVYSHWHMRRILTSSLQRHSFIRDRNCYLGSSPVFGGVMCCSSFYFSVLCVLFCMSSSCVLFAQCCQCLWIANYWLSLRFSLTFIYKNVLFILR